MKQRLIARLQDLRFAQSMATTPAERAQIEHEIQVVLEAIERAGGM